jgi:cytochrome c
MQKTLVIFFSLLSVVGAAQASAELANSKNCMGCHNIGVKVVGPAYKDVAAKYKGDPKAVDYLTTKILKGGSGVWGAIPMPANTQLNEAEAKQLAKWVLQQK